MKQHSQMISEDFLKTIMRQILLAVESIHEKKLLIGELSLDQIFISVETNIIKLEPLDQVDISSKMKEKIGEKISSEMWKLGILFLMLAKHISDRKNLNLFKLLQMISSGDIVEEIQISLNAWDLMKKLLSKKPKERISAKLALMHEWFDKEKS